MELIDLSQEIYQGMPVYPGHLKTVIWQHASHEETARNFEGGFSFVSSGIMLCDHGPTHVDAIAHLDPREGAPTIDAMALDTFYGEATCLDVSHKGPHEYVSADELSAAEQSGGVRVEPGMILLVRTGAADRLRGVGGDTQHGPPLHEVGAGGGSTRASTPVSTSRPRSGCARAASRRSASTRRAPTTRSRRPIPCT